MSVLVWPKCGQGSQATTSARSSADCQGEADNPDEASSSRSQVQTRTASAAASLAWDRPSVGVRWRPPSAVAIVTHFVTQPSCVRGRLLAWTVTVTATMAGRLTAVREPRASMRARSYHASPGRCKASVLWIDLWMLWTNRLVNRCEAVDGRGCGKVDNGENVSLCRAGSLCWPQAE